MEIDKRYLEEMLERGKDTIPLHFYDSIYRYVIHRIPTGGFLCAVLEHDLFETHARADQDSLRHIHSLVKFIYNDVPSVCHGSPAKVTEWLEGRNVD